MTTLDLAAKLIAGTEGLPSGSWHTDFPRHESELAAVGNNNGNRICEVASFHDQRWPGENWQDVWSRNDKGKAAVRRARLATAAHIANCSPENIKAICEALIAKDTALQEAVEALQYLSGYLGVAAHTKYDLPPEETTGLVDKIDTTLARIKGETPEEPGK